MRWLLDEMLPRAAVAALNARGHDAVSVADIGLRSARDIEVYRVAFEQSRTIVTEDRRDFARIVNRELSSGRATVPVVVVHKNRLGRRGALPNNLADALHRWSLDNPEPYPGPHWL